MTRKERRELARKIAKEEKVIRKYKNDKDAVDNAQERISKLILSYELTPDDIDYMDDLIQKILS